MRLHHFAVAASVIALAGCNAGKPPVDLAAVRAAITANDRNVERWVLNSAVDSVATGYYAPDAIIFLANSPPSKGTEAIKKMWAGLTDAGSLRMHIQAADLVVTDSLAVDHGTYTLELRAKPPADTNKVLLSDKGNYVTSFVQRDGKWLALYDIAVTDVPLPPAAPATKTRK